jgi:CDP-paratose 2-epimerase
VKPWKILVTGSSGLIGSEAVEYFDRQGHRVVGSDNNMRRVFSSPSGDTLWNLERLKRDTRQFIPVAIDIRDRDGVTSLFREHRFDIITHCAAQPSHDKAANIALLDFEVNAFGTVNLREAARQLCRDAAIIFMSTNKVYGDAPNERRLRENETRYDYSDAADDEGAEDLAKKG